MKMSPVHFAQLETSLLDVIKNSGKCAVELYLSYFNMGLTDKRFRWDMTYAIPTAIRKPWFDEVYAYCNDDHIDTALKAIFKKLLG